MTAGIHTFFSNPTDHASTTAAAAGEPLPHDSQHIAPDDSPWFLPRTPRKPLNAALIVLAACLLMGMGWIAGRLEQADPATTGNGAVRGVLPAEFEQHEALRLAWDSEEIGWDSEMETAQYRALSEIVAAFSGQNLQIVILTPNERHLAHAIKTLKDADISRAMVRFIYTPTKTAWLTDFGPRSPEFGATRHVQPHVNILVSLPKERNKLIEITGEIEKNQDKRQHGD